MNSLEQAKAYFYSWKLIEAYHIFRRFFDRLPFRAEPEHAEYIGIFARILLELGKNRELDFYQSKLEEIYAKSKNPMVAYPLAAIYRLSPTPKEEASRELLEEILKNPNAVQYHVKTRLLLAGYYYDKGNASLCRALVEPILPQADTHIETLVQIWRACVFQLEKKYRDAEILLKSILKSIKIDTDWYGYFSAMNILALVYTEQNKLELAQKILAMLRKGFERRFFKSVQTQIAHVESIIQQKSTGMPIVLIEDQASTTLRYANRSFVLHAGSPSEKLLLLLLRKGVVDKTTILKNLYGRSYGGPEDDKLVYYQIHSLRKRLSSFGLPAGAVTNDTKGYRLIPLVTWKGIPHEHT